MNDLPELETIESPCIGQCCLNEQDICLGCYRSLEEITSWTLVDNDTRRQYLQNVAERKKERE
ncbi:DUF1289 domain-containing protein [Methylomarinum vadi]|uniref:DUF1289 domain-containing protein n=1 Tax=Methylomarinum vadi TaxID=438855 RepID=UPI0004DF5D4E|nr:DUF1289 domain-containing protein [Methylomarinum vadi]